MLGRAIITTPRKMNFQMFCTLHLRKSCKNVYSEYIEHARGKKKFFMYNCTTLDLMDVIIIRVSYSFVLPSLTRLNRELNGKMSSYKNAKVLNNTIFKAIVLRIYIYTGIWIVYKDISLVRVRVRAWSLCSA